MTNTRCHMLAAGVGVLRALAPAGAVVDDNTDFFELGLPSVRMVELATSLSAAWGRELGLQDVYEHASIANLARHHPAAASELRLQTWAEEGSHPVNASQSVRLERMRRESASGKYVWQGRSNVIIGSVDLPLSVSANTIAGAVRRTSLYHSALRLHFSHRHGGYRMHVAPEALEVDMFHGGSADEAAAGLANPFEFTTGVLARVRTVRLTDRWRLFVAVEHIACDAHSLQILLRDLRRRCLRIPDSGPQPTGVVRANGHELGRLEQLFVESSHGQRALEFWRTELGAGSVWRPFEHGGVRRPADDERELIREHTTVLGSAPASWLRHRAASLGTSLSTVLAMTIARSAVDAGSDAGGAIYPYRDNRWSPRLAETVGPLVTAVTLPFSRLLDDVDDAADFCNAAFRFSTYPIDRLSRVLDPPTWLKPSVMPLLILDVQERPAWAMRPGLGAGPTVVTQPGGLPLGLTVSIGVDKSRLTVRTRHPSGFLGDQDSRLFHESVIRNLSVSHAEH